MKQPINQIETTKVLADPPRPKTKATTVIALFLLAAGALFAGAAAFGIYTRNQWTGAVQQRTNEAARLLVGVAHPEKSTGSPIGVLTVSTREPRGLRAKALEQLEEIAAAAAPFLRRGQVDQLSRAATGRPLVIKGLSPAWREVGTFLGPSIRGFYERYPVARLLELWCDAGIRDVRARPLSLGAGIVVWGTRT